MDRHFTAADAFDVDTPIGTLPLGGVEYPVPPLSFGRWLRLTSFDFGQLMTHMGGVMSAIDEEDAGRAIAAELTDVACVLVPGLPEAAWKEHADLYAVCKLIVILGRNHDWNYIAAASHFGEPPDEDAPPDRTVEEGLLAFSALYPGYVTGDFFGMRLEGFYRTMDAAVKRAREQNAMAGNTAPEPTEGLPGVRDPERFAALSAMVDGAQAVTEAPRG